MSIANWNPAKLTLVVDLDDTLISTDTMLENFWLAWSVRWQTPLARIIHRRWPEGLAGVV